MANCKVIAVTNQKGRRGQDHDHRQPRHRACPAEQAGAAYRRRCTRLFDPLPRLSEATE